MRTFSFVREVYIESVYVFANKNVEGAFVSMLRTKLDIWATTNIVKRNIDSKADKNFRTKNA